MKTNVTATDCRTLINGWTDISEGERESMLSELLPYSQCPDVSYIKVFSGEVSLLNF